MLTINLPYSLNEYKISGVYKILFSDGSFYIGGSSDIRKRSYSWDSFFRTQRGIAGFDIGTKMLNKIKENLNASLDIVELCSVSDLRDKEGFYLFKNKDNPLMLSVWDNGAWKPVLQYKTDGIFVKKHMSISGAAKYIKSPIVRVQDVIYGNKKTHKGMVFVFEKDYGERRKDIIKRRYKHRTEKKAGRDVVMYDLSLVELKRYKTIAAASINEGISKTCITDALNGRQKTSKGYIWKYA